MKGTDKKDLIGEIATDTESGLGSFILRVAIKTLIIFLVIFSLAATLFGCLFPKTYMKMYRSLGLYGKSSAYAATAAQRALSSHTDDCDGNCEYLSVLTDGIGISSIAAFSDRHNVERWERLSGFTGDYLSASCHEKRSAKTDNTYLKEYGFRGLASISILYGYDDYVWGEYIGSLRIADKDKTTELMEKAIAAEISVQNAEVLNMLPEYISYYSRTVESKDDVTLEYSIQCPRFYSVEGYTELRNVYFGYSNLAESLPSKTLSQAAIKSSLLYRLMTLSSEMDELEQNYIMSERWSFSDKAVVELASEDLFGEKETKRLRALYSDVINIGKNTER